MTKTDLANLAISKIGERLIDSIDDTGDKVARLAKLHYEPTLREVLRAHFWGFAMGSKTVLASNFILALSSADLLPTDLQTLMVSGDPTVSGAPVEFLPMTYAGVLNGIFQYTDTGNQASYVNSLHYSPFDSGFALTWYDSGASIIRQWTATQSGSGVTSPTQITAPFVGFAPAGGTPTLLMVQRVASYEGQWIRHGDEAPYRWFRATGLTEWEETDDYEPPPHPDVLGWTTAFPIPADFIKLRKLIDPTTADPIDKFDFRRVAGVRHVVSGDFDAVALDYVQFVDDPEEYDPLFVEAFVTLLASKLGRAVSGSEAMEAKMREIYELNALPAARTSNAHDTQSNENHPLREFLDGTLTPGRGDFFSRDAD